LRKKSKVRRRGVRVKKSEILFEFICRNPGLNVTQIANELNWSTRSVKQIITRLKKAGRIESKIFPSIKILPSINKNELSETLQQINTQFNKLDIVKEGLKNKEKESFEKCVEAQVKHDQRTATIYANHCAQIRDLNTLLERGELILRRLSLILGIAQIGRSK
jgi:division protein CdvB (Snf7/Vps24/ESCRT-III family)